MAVIGGDPLADFTILVTSNIDGAVAGLATLSGSLEGLQGTFSAMTAVGGALTVGLTLPIMALAAGAVLSENTMQGFYQTLQAGAVSSSISFDQLKDSFNQLYSQFPQGGTVIANTLLNVSNIMASTFGGNQQDIQNFTAQILAASQMTGQAADSMSKSVATAFTQFKVSSADAIPEFTYLYSAAQLAREPVSTLADELGQYGPTLSAFKLPMNDIIALLGNLNQSGLDTSKTVTGIGYAFATLEAGGKTMAPVLDAISKEEGGISTSSMTATQLLEGLFKGIEDGSISAADASDIFGKRYAANIYSAISSGHLSFQQFEADAGSFNGSLTDMADNSATLSQKLDELKHDFEEALAPLGLTIVNTLEGFMPVIVSILNYVKDLLTLFNELPQPIQDVVIIFAAVLAALGPILLIVGSLGSAFLVIGPAIGLMIPLLGGVLVQLGLMDVAMGILDALSLPLLVTFGLIAVAVAGLVLLGVELYNNWKPFHDLVDDIAKAIGLIPDSKTFTYSVTDTSQPKPVSKAKGGTGLTPPPGASVIPVNPPAATPAAAPAGPSTGPAASQDVPAEVGLALKPIASWFESNTAPQWYHDPQKGYYQSQGTPAGATSVNTPAEIGLAAHDIVAPIEGIKLPSWGEATKGGLLDPNEWNNIKLTILSFGGWVSGGLGTISSDFKKFGGDVVSFFQPLVSGIKTAAADIAGAALWIGSIFIGMQEVICGVMIFIGFYVGQAWNTIVSIVGPPLNTMKNDIEGGLNTIKVFFENTWNSIVSFFQGVWNSIVNILGPPLNTMKIDVQNFVTWIWNAFTTGLNAIKNAFETGLNDIKTFFTNIWNGIVSFLTGIWTSLTTQSSQGANTVKTNAESPINTLVSDLKGLWNTIVTDCQNAWNTLCNWISQIKIPMPAMPDVKGWLEGIPGGGLIIKGLEDMHIPGFGEGGIVTEPTFAMLAEKGPELVIPVSAIQGASQVSNMVPQLGSQAQTTGKGGDFNFDVNIERATLVTPQDAQVLGLQIAYTAQRELARAGYTPG
jgi:TP901 family phage tail tape measure protein